MVRDSKPRRKNETTNGLFLSGIDYYVGGAPVYPETYHRTTDNNGVICFCQYQHSPKTGSSELQRAREQAEIEYWRAVEAKARSSRHTPDTEVYRRVETLFTGRKLQPAKCPVREKISRTGNGNI